jgi:uncharacterized protein YbjT (DUF2867 family)
MQQSYNFCHDLPTSPLPELGRILVTGATGYIGGRLVPELLERGYRVRAMVRGIAPEVTLRWPDVEVAVADALDIDSLMQALEGVHTAYYLIHSLLLGQKKFASADIEAAINFREAAEKQGLKRIIYLGGLGDVQLDLSTHLKSRIMVAQELMLGSVPATFLRAAIIIGSGSASYEIIKHLVQNCPVILVPSWARTKCQPIAIRDVIKYLVGVLEKPEETAGRSFDIGGKDIVTYEMMLKILSEIHLKKRLFVPFSVKTIKLYAYAASLLTPVPAAITMCLMESCHNDVICQNDDIRRIIPFQPMPYREALVRAMSREETDNVATRWSDAYPPACELAIKLNEVESFPLYRSSYSMLTAKKAPSVFASITRIGGKEGWFRSNILWRIRGWCDRILMGVGVSRGRRSSTTLRINDVIDFWRVEDLRENERLLLRSEMKMPGRAWLEFTLSPDTKSPAHVLSVNAYFQARSFWGKMYWYLFLPFHVFIFNDLIQQIEKRSL